MCFLDENMAICHVLLTVFTVSINLASQATIDPCQVVVCVKDVKHLRVNDIFVGRAL